MSNPIVKLWKLLPEDGSKIIITKELTIQLLAWMRAADPTMIELRYVDELLNFLHKENVITLSYTEVGQDRINFIQRKL